MFDKIRLVVGAGFAPKIPLTKATKASALVIIFSGLNRLSG
jgi:hypothetical protein